jgi:hypothetical protein
MSYYKSTGMGSDEESGSSDSEEEKQDKRRSVN